MLHLLVVARHLHRPAAWSHDGRSGLRNSLCRRRLVLVSAAATANVAVADAVAVTAINAVVVAVADASKRESFIFVVVPACS
eukprot:2731185-Pleurochrysis_carterae.AAC.1